MSNFENLFKKAYEFLQDGKNEKALIKLNEAEKSFSEDGNEIEITQEDIEILRGSIYFSLGDSENASNSFKKALELNHSSSEASLGLGLLFFSDNMNKEAKEMIEWAVKNDPKNERAAEALRKLNVKLGFPQMHNSLLNDEEETDLSSESENDLLNKAYSLFIADNFDEALRLTQKIKKTKRKEAEILKGNIYLSIGKLEDAKESFENVLRIDPKSSAAFNGLAEYFNSKHKLDDAKTMYEYALKSNPDDQFALLGLSKINKELGFSPFHYLNAAFNELDFPKEIRTKLDESFQLFNDKNFSESVNVLENIEEELKNVSVSEEALASVKNFLGFNYLALKKLDEAKNLFENALMLNPNSSQASAGLGEVLFISGNDKDAKIMYEWAVKNNPDNIFAVKGLAKVNRSLNLPADNNSLALGVATESADEFSKLLTSAYELFDKKEYGKVLEVLEHASELLDESSINRETKKSFSSIKNFKGFCYLAMNHIDEAHSNFEESLRLNPNSSQACAGLGEIFYLQGKDEQAKTMFEWALKNEPNNQFAIAELKKVKENLNSTDGEVKNKNELATFARNLIEEGYKLFKNKKFEDSLNKLDTAEKMIEENFSEEENALAICSLNNFMGFNYLSLAKDDFAQTKFEKSLGINPQSSQACAGLGEVFSHKGKDKEAKTMFEWAVKNNPNNNYAVLGLTRVNKILGYEENHNSLLEKE